MALTGKTVGLNQCAENSIAGSTFVAFDKVESGSLSYDGGEVQENEGTGGQVSVYRDMVVSVGNANTMLQAGELLACIKPATVGALPAIIQKIQGGTVNVADEGRLHEDCYIKTCKLGCSKGGVLMVAYDWVALLETAQTTIASAAAHKTEANFPWHNQAVTFDGGALACQSWEVSTETGVEAQTSQDLKTSGVQRRPEWIDAGPFSATLTASVRVPLDIDFTADYPSTFTFAVTAHNVDGDTFSLSMAGGGALQVQGNPIPIVRGKEAALYEITGKIKTNDLAAFVCSITAA